MFILIRFIIQLLGKALAHCVRAKNDTSALGSIDVASGHRCAIFELNLPTSNVSTFSSESINYFTQAHTLTTGGGKESF